MNVIRENRESHPGYTNNNPSRDLRLALATELVQLAPTFDWAIFGLELAISADFFDGNDGSFFDANRGGFFIGRTFAFFNGGDLARCAVLGFFRAGLCRDLWWDLNRLSL